MIKDFDNHLFVILFALVFGIFHSGMAHFRARLERYIPPRIYRILFVLVSFLIATPWLIFLVNHRYDGLILFNFQENSFVHKLVFCLSALAFFFLYPGTFRFSEIVTIRKPTQKIYSQGIIRITRHPQLIGMSLWCLAHFIWIGSTFTIASSLGLIAYHVFATWHSDHKRIKLFGESYQKLIKSTSIIPFGAIFRKQQKIILKEFLDKAYLWVIVFISVVYYFHPWIVENFPKAFSGYLAGSDYFKNP